MFSPSGFPLEFVKLAPEHFGRLDLQERQRRQYGLDVLELGAEVAEAYASEENAWACLFGERVLAIMGISETFAGAQGVAFALFAKDLGRSHHSLTRFARDIVIGQSRLRRIEAIVPCRDIEPLIAGYYAAAEATDLIDLALDQPTPEIRWAMTVGFKPAAVLRKFGAAGETYMLLERIR